MVVDRLQFFLDSCHCISERQAGFRKGYNTTEQVARLSQCIKDGFHWKQSSLAVFIDFKCAFDRVCKNLLLRKLLNLNISGNLYRWIRESVLYKCKLWGHSFWF